MKTQPHKDSALPELLAAMQEWAGGGSNLIAYMQSVFWGLAASAVQEFMATAALVLDPSALQRLSQIVQHPPQ